MSQSVCDRGIALVREQILPDNEDMTTPAGHCAGKIVRSVILRPISTFTRIWGSMMWLI